MKIKFVSLYIKIILNIIQKSKFSFLFKNFYQVRVKNYFAISKSTFVRQYMFTGFE